MTNTKPTVKLKLRTFTFLFSENRSDNIFNYMSDISKNVYNISIFIQNFFLKLKNCIYKVILDKYCDNKFKIQSYEFFNKIIIDEFLTCYKYYSDNYQKYKQNYNIIYNNLIDLIDGRTLNNINIFGFRRTAKDLFVNIKTLFYDKFNKSIFYDDIIDEILKRFYDKSYFKTKYEKDNRIPFTTKDAILIDNVLANKYIFEGYNNYGYKDKITLYVKQYFKNTEGIIPPLTVVPLTLAVITSNENIIGHILYQNLGDNKDKLPSDVINRILSKSKDNFSSYWALKNNGRKSRNPQYLKKSDKFVIPYLDGHGMYKVNDNEYKIFLGKHINQNFIELIDKNLTCLRNNMNSSIYTENDNINDKMNKTRINEFIHDNPDMLTYGGYLNISIPKNLHKYDKNESYDKSKIYYKEIHSIEIVPVKNKYKICVTYEPITKEMCKDEDINIIDDGISIDLGVNNTMVIYNPKGYQFIIKGNIINKINDYFNKKISEEQSKLKKINNLHTSKKLQQLFNKRDNIINGYFDAIVNWMFYMYGDKKLIIIGKNINWKHKVNMGRNMNRKFYKIPYNKLVNKIKNKGEKKGIKVVIQEESYTSICDALNLEKICYHKDGEYSGERIERGLFKSKNGKLINADLNGAINIMRKYCTIKEVIYDKILGKGIYNPRVKLINMKC